MSGSYLGATESELRQKAESQRLAGYADQRRLFPHSGRLQIEPQSLVLEGWREIPRSAITDVRLTFTEVYPRSRGAGFRGNYASFGLFGSLGKPLVLGLRGDEPVYLLIDFQWLTGINRARQWAPSLQRWLAEGAGIQ
jgi:hypothetical protein